MIMESEKSCCSIDTKSETITNHEHEHMSHQHDKKTYQPIIAIFSVTFLMALAFEWQMTASFNVFEVAKTFVAISMSVLGILKLRDLSSFSKQFEAYDLLAKKWSGYSYVYPFVETLAGVGMIAGILTYVVAPSALVIGIIGAVSVIKSVYLDKKDFACACVGGDSKVPLGSISLIENLMMIGMGLYMLFA